MENLNNSRWWEMYLVRYITGSVVGAVIVYIFLIKIGIDLIPQWGDIKSANLLALGVLGFTYCYLASAPITLLHATRSLYGKQGGLGVSNFIFGALLFFAALGSIFLAWRTYPYLLGLSMLVGMFLFFVYFRAIDLFHKVEHWEQWHIWYSSLALSREKGSKEFIESYRHLREHGNAFFIVLLEIALAIPLYMIISLPSETEKKVAFMLLAAILWLSLGMVCWILGNSLERYLIKTPSLQTGQQPSQSRQYRRPEIRHCQYRKRVQ